MKAEILSIGTELLLGEITDTNASYLAGELPALGIDLYWVTQVGDNMERLVEALGRAWQRSDLILCSGGLGPTDDDITREAIAKLLNEELRLDSALEQDLRRKFAGRNRPMPVSNLKQANLIPSSKALPNVGTAPGWWVERDGHIIVAMPGPPWEMQAVWQKEVLPRLKPHIKGEVILRRTLKIFGMSEAEVGELVRPWMSLSNPTAGVYAKTDGIQVRLGAKASSAGAAQQIIADAEAQMRSLLGDHIWGTDDETLETVIGKLLTGKGLTLATMESCSGGLLANTITDVPGSSAYFKGGYVSYTRKAKAAWGVPSDLIEQHGAVSPQVAMAMATAARHNLQADIGLSITGVAGPNPSEGKPVGLGFVGVDDGRQTRCVQGNYPPLPRVQIKRWAIIAALFELRKTLLAL